MLTAFNIEEHSSGVLRFLRRNRIRVEHRYCDDASLKCVTYEHHRGKIGWNAVDRFIKAQRNHVLCPPELVLPSDSGYKRFTSTRLSRRMCENAALYLLRTAALGGLKVVLIDEAGDSVGLCEWLTDHCELLTVLTGTTDVYAAQADYLLNEKGAVIRVCRDTGCLRDADLVIAPAALTHTLPCRSRAMILTGEKPTSPQNCTAVYKYFIDLPAKYRELCPAFLDEMYFAEALFVMGGIHALGSEVFSRCGDGNVIHTRLSLVRRLKALIQEPDASY